MRRGELRIIDELRGQPQTVGALAEAIEKSQSWTSELVQSLEEQHLVTKNGAVELAETYEATLIADLLRTYDVEKILVGTREEILATLLDGPMTVAELEQQGFASSTVYAAVNDFGEVGVVEETGDGYEITDETLRQFLIARQSTQFETVYETNGEQLIKTSSDDRDGTPTAFSAFQRYDIDYYPTDTYLYRGDREVEIEDVLIHAVLAVDTRKQMAICGVFYLAHRAALDSNDLWRLAGTWDCVERWADLQAFLDQRDVKQDELFLPWDEFAALARDYGVYPRGKHPEDSLLTGVTEVGETLDERVDAYLLGGANLILRGLKDTTKDIDVVLEDRERFLTLADALQGLGYEERRDLEAVYEQLTPSVVLEKDGFPRWDVFVDVVADALHLTGGMQDRSKAERQFGNLHLHLLSLTDIFVFKAVTDREGDLEDAALIARQGAVDWQQVMDEIERQEAQADQYFSFAVLDTLDLLADRYGIEAPIRSRLASYCLEHALLLTLEEPKTIEDLREELDFPDHQIYNKLRKLEDEGAIDVDRSGTLNTYQAVTD
jgi:predicted transcriptional regulator